MAKARASYHWGSFLGGEWSPRAQGNISDPRYGTALALCYNSLPVEAGVLTRRPGLWFIGARHKGWPGLNRSFRLNDNTYAVMEFSADPAGGTGAMRIWLPPYMTGFGDKPYGLYCDGFDQGNCTLSSATPAVLTTASAQSWVTGDTVVLFRSTGESVAARQFTIARLTSTTFSLADSVTGFGIDGTRPEFNVTNYKVGHVKVWSTPYTTVSWARSVRLVPCDKLVVVLDGSRQVTPYVLTVTYPGTSPRLAFTLAALNVGVMNGPYLDPLPGLSQTRNSTATITLDVDTVSWDIAVTDSAYTFTAADVLKAIRVWGQPPKFNTGTSYSMGDSVTYQNTFWTMGKSGVPSGTAPGQNYGTGGVSYTPWTLNPLAGQWSWGQITALINGTTVKCSLTSDTDQGPNVNGSAIDTWQIGAYYPGSFPTSGTWAEGRLWLAGAIPNRIDSTISGITPDNLAITQSVPKVSAFSLTDAYGQVLDNHAIQVTLNCTDVNDVLWMLPDKDGIVCGTKSYEFLLFAPPNDILTPTSIESKPISKYGTLNANLDPPFPSPAIVMLGTDAKMLYEYLADAFTNRYVARPVNRKARHLMGGGVKELTYQRTTTPLLWAVQAVTGQLKSCTYRRLSRWVTEEPISEAWAQHFHGAGRLFEDLCVGSMPDGSSEGIVTTTTTSLSDNNQPRYMEYMSPVTEDGDAVATTVNVDEPMRVSFGSDAIAGGGGGGSGTTASGKFYFEAKLVSTALSSHGSLIIGFGGKGIRNSGVGMDQADANIAVVTAHNGQAVISGTVFGAGIWAGYSDGDTIAFAVDTANKLFWVRNVTTNSSWAPGTPVPASGGFTTSGIDTSGGLFLFFAGNGFSGTDEVVINTNNTPTFSGTIPSGYGAWGSTFWAPTHSTYLIGAIPGMDSNETMDFPAPTGGYAGGTRARVTQVVGTASTVDGTVPLYTIIWDLGRPYMSGSSTDSSIPHLNAGWFNTWIGSLAAGGKASP